MWLIFNYLTCVSHRTKVYSPLICSSHDTHKSFRLPDFNKSVRIRFGAVKKYPKQDIDFPSPAAIAMCRNKIRMKEALLRAGVNTPALIWFPTNKGIIYKSANHSRGKGMIVCYTLKEAREAFENNLGKGYMEQMINSAREFRVHVADGRCFHVDEKTASKKSIIRNLDNGYRYEEPKDYIPLSVVKESIKAVAALGLDFGAVDACVDYRGSAYVFEVNSAPGLRETTRKKYEKQLIKLILKKGGGAKK